MENASKALIIAGAILISIILIGIGVALIKSAGDVTDDASKTATAIDQSAGGYVTNIENQLKTPAPTPTPDPE